MKVREQAQQRVENYAKWLDANPALGGFDNYVAWLSQEYSKYEPKIYLEKEMLDSPIYRSLSRVAMLVYQDFLGKRFMDRGKGDKRNFWIITNNGKISFPYSEAEKMGYSRQQFRDAIDELQWKGFIDIKHQGKGGRKPAKGTGDMTTYWIDDRWKDYGTDEFKPPRNPRKKDTRKGRGFGSIWQVRERGMVMNKKAQETLKRKNMGIENDTR